MAGRHAHPRKRRTRQHVIADLSVNHVERHVLRCGFYVERVRGDYGLDLLVFLYDGRGHVRPGRIAIQLKATDRPAFRDGGRSVACAVDRRDLHHWLETSEPVILVLYDARRDRAYWAYVQAHFAAANAAARRVGTTVVVRLPTASVVDETAIRAFAGFSDDVRARQRGTIGAP